MTYPPAAWQNLGRLLARRRVELDPKWKSRVKFTDDTGLNERLVSDIENARRTSYRATTFEAVEQAYKLASGSLMDALANPHLTEFPHRAGTASITPQTEDQPRQDLAVHTTDEPEPNVPPGPPRGFSDGPAGSREWRLGNRERAIWDGDEPWPVRWSAIKILRGGTAPLRSTNPGDEQINGRRGA